MVQVCLTPGQSLCQLDSKKKRKQTNNKHGSYSWILRMKNIGCLTSCCPIGVHQTHPDTFQSSRKRMADLGEARSPRLQDIESAAHDDCYLCSLISMWQLCHLTSSSLGAALFLGHLQVEPRTPVCSRVRSGTWHQWMLCSGIRDGSRRKEPWCLASHRMDSEKELLTCSHL